MIKFAHEKVEESFCRDSSTSNINFNLFFKMEKINIIEKIEYLIEDGVLKLQYTFEDGTFHIIEYPLF